MEIFPINGWIKRSATAFTFVAEATILARDVKDFDVVTQVRK